MTRLLTSLLLAGAAMIPCFVLADSETFGDYTVYYQAVNSTFLNEEIAEQYGIVRSARRAFLNISIMKQEEGGFSTAVPAQVSGGRINLLQQTRNINFREIREENAIYYIGEFDFSNAEIVRFSVTVLPESENEAHEVNWETRLYAD